MGPNTAVSYTSAPLTSAKLMLDGASSFRRSWARSWPVKGSKTRVSTSRPNEMLRAAAASSTRCARLKGYAM